MPKRWIVERWLPEHLGSGTIPDVADAHGENGHLALLTHQDVVEPGRIKAVGLEGDGPPVLVELARDETLVIAFRGTVQLNALPGQPPPMTWTVIGAKGPRGERYLFIAPNGAVKLSSDLNAV